MSALKGPWGTEQSDLTECTITPTGQSPVNLADAVATSLTSVAVLANVAALRAYNGEATVVRTLCHSTAGYGAASYFATSDVTSADNGASIIAASNGQRWYLSPDDQANITIDQAGADPTGLTDSTAACLAALAVNPHPYVPNSTYWVSAEIRPDGFWGPGVFQYEGVQNAVIPLPASPRIASLVQTILTRLAKSSHPNGVFIWVGDSISEHYYETTPAFNHVNMLQKALSYKNGFTPSPSVELTDLNDTTYGQVFSGTTTAGTNGPIGKSIILAAGATMTITGLYAYLMIVYMAKSGGGTLTVTRNGETIATIATATSGAEQEEISWPNQTNGTAITDSYVFAATGASVELTGVLGVAGTGSAEFPIMYFCRHALSGMSTTLFSQDALMNSSILRTSILSGNAAHPGIVMIALGTNNANTVVAGVGTTPAVYAQQLGYIVKTYLAAGFDVMLMGLMAPNAVDYPLQAGNFSSYISAQKAVADQYGIEIVDLDALDWISDALQQDGLHPNNAGAQKVVQLVCETMASPSFSPGKANRNAEIAFTPSIEWVAALNTGSQTEIPAVTAGTVLGSYFLDGHKCKFSVSASMLTPAANTNGGELCVSLPFPAAGAAGLFCNGVVGNMYGVSSTATGAAFWTVQAVPVTFQQGVPEVSVGYAVIRSGAMTGTYGDAVLSAGCDIQFTLEYLIA